MSVPPLLAHIPIVVGLLANYSVHILWSQEDGAYIATVMELAGCVADGQTPEEALTNLRVVVEEWLEVAKEEKRPIPEPATADG